MSFDDAAVKKFRARVRTDMKTHGSDALRIIAPIEPDVARLPEATLAFGGFLDRRILVKDREVRREGHLKNCPPPGLEHAEKLAHRDEIVIDVLEHVIADDGVESIIGKREVLKIHPGINEMAL
jgi:hypothetical protein